MKKQSSVFGLLLALIFAALSFLPALGQTESFRLVLKREWGLGMPGAVQGHMSLNLKGELEAVQNVTYYIDDKEMAQLQMPDIKFRFITDDYPSGPHKLHAVVKTQDGSQVTSSVIEIKFIAKDEANKINKNIWLWVGGLTALVLVVSVLLTRRANQANRRSDRPVTGSGLYGAAVCPKCGKAFTRTIVGLNLLTHRYEPCPHCGKWSMTQAATPAELEAAQLPETKQIESDVPQPDSLYNEREQIDESKYTEL